MAGTPRKILIVDPDAELRGAVASVLAGYNYSVSLAPGAADALAALDADPPDLALLDLGLDDGAAEGGHLGLVRAIRERPVPVVCIAMSARGDAAAAVAAQRAGAADYLLKPVPLETLLAALDRGFERVSRERRMAFAIDELAMARDALQHAERAKIAILSSTRRELRQPLNAMLGHAEILRSQLYGPLGDLRYVDYAERLIVDLKRLIDLVGRIGDRAAIEAGVLTLAEKPLDVVALVAECIANSRAGRHGEGRVFDSNLPAEPLVLNADPWRLRQAIADAVANAAKFNCAGGRIAVSLTSNEARDIEIRIESEHPGFIPEGQAARSDADATEGGSRNAAAGEAIIGLRQAEKFIAMHGGSMKCRNRPGFRRSHCPHLAGIPPRRRWAEPARQLALAVPHGFPRALEFALALAVARRAVARRLLAWRAGGAAQRPWWYRRIGRGVRPAPPPLHRHGDGIIAQDRRRRIERRRPCHTAAASPRSAWPVPLRSAEIRKRAITPPHRASWS